MRLSTHWSAAGGPQPASGSGRSRNPQGTDTLVVSAGIMSFCLEPCGPAPPPPARYPPGYWMTPAFSTMRQPASGVTRPLRVFSRELRSVPAAWSATA